MLYMGYALNQGIPSLCAVKKEAGVVFARILYQDGVFRRMSDGDRRSLAKTDRQGKVQTAAEKAKHNACIKQRIAGLHKAKDSWSAQNNGSSASLLCIAASSGTLDRLLQVPPDQTASVPGGT